ncbi:GNAT family N-acetyltransferase [Qipengyuania sp. DSG2-2]|uniref:GNAT family N-acetyltransferase n=1 Tax=Qipengyuania sp. DGS2-2 TaxID=3349631 RepID=UPI0036D2BCFB
MASQARTIAPADPVGMTRVVSTRAGSVPAVAWDALAQNASTPNPFFERWCLLPALAAFDPAYSVRLACFYRDERLIGLLPLALSGDYYGYPVPHQRAWLHANAFCGAPLVLAGQEHTFWAALLEWADAAQGNAMFLHLTGLPSDGPLYDALRDTTARDRRPAAVVQREERAMLISDLSPEDYFAQSMSTKKRKELRRQSRRLGEEGALEFVRQTDDAQLPEWTQQFLALEASGWKGNERSALASAPDTAAFFRDSLAGAAQAGRLERLSLNLDGAPIAMLANFLTAPGSFSFKTAYDERYARFSPGVLLQRENLDILAREDIAWCDSCAAPDHPMIERIWREKREVVRVSVALGGIMRRQAARAFLTAENRALPKGL